LPPRPRRAGGPTCAVVLPASSVGTAQLKANAVTGAKVRTDRSPRPTSRPACSPPPAIVVRTHAETETGPGIEDIAVSCAPGEQAVGGGVSLSTGGGGTILASYPVQVGSVFAPASKDGQTPNGWFTSFTNPTGPTRPSTTPSA
jgi:hypothetical protein